MRPCFRPAVVVALLLTLPLLGGCAGGLEIAAIGAVAKAASAGGSTMKLGKVDMALMTTPEVIADAAYVSFDELGMRIFSDALSDDAFRRRITAMNPRGNEYRVLIKPVTDEVTFVRIDVGLFGNNGVGQLIVNRVRENLELNGVDAEAD